MENETDGPDLYPQVHWGGILVVFIFFVGFIFTILYPSSSNFKTSAIDIKSGEAGTVASLVIIVCSLIVLLVLVGQQTPVERVPRNIISANVTWNGYGISYSIPN